MIQKAFERLRDAQAARTAEGEAADAGFTLIELMVVLLIMGILMAIAIPTFLGVTKGANDKSAQSDLTNALTAAKSYYVEQQAYSGTSFSFTAGVGQSDEPSLTWTTPVTTTSSNTAGNNTVYVISVGDQHLELASYASDRVCWYVLDAESGSSVISSTNYSGVANAGVWYGGATGGCSSSGPSQWYSSYGAAQAAGNLP